MRGAPLPTATVTSRAHGVHASWVSLECLVGVVCRGCAGALLAAVLSCSLESGGPRYVGVHCGGSCAGVKAS
jgi:hypothetical protein